MHRTYLSLLNVSVAVMLGAAIFAQCQSRREFVNPSRDRWPTYNGDYSGRRFSALNQINRNNVGELTMAWAFQASLPSGASLKSTPLVVDGMMYFSVPDHVWAIDARSGREIWHYAYPKNEGFHIGQRGVAIYKDLLYFEATDGHLIRLTAQEGLTSVPLGHVLAARGPMRLVERLTAARIPFAENRLACTYDTS
jgi:alcohol dehydrogenase (cytochrome c)